MKVSIVKCSQPGGFQTQESATNQTFQSESMQCCSGDAVDEFDDDDGFLATHDYDEAMVGVETCE